MMSLEPFLLFTTMSPTLNEGMDNTKLPRAPRACQTCHKRKIKCDAGLQPRCSNCIQANLECIFATKVRPTKAYIDALERRSEALEALLRQSLPDADLEALLAQDIDSLSFNNDEDVDDDAHFIHVPRQGSLAFFGKSSEHSLVNSVMEMTDALPDDQRKVMGAKRRQEFWGLRTWETARIERRPTYDFPPHDLMASLVDLYFDNINLFLPLLHRPTFDKLLAKGEHFDTSKSFGSVVMLVTAIGSQFSTDPRVLLEEYPESLSAGWKWFRQVRPTLYSFVDTYTTTLYDLQAAALAILFAMGSVSHVSTWFELGIALRAAQDIGAHRKKPRHKQPDPVTNELLKRAWWVLVCLDRHLSSGKGRPCLIHREDFDVDLPIDCDDEYWEHPDPMQRFRQPPGKPSLVSSFICYIRMNDLLAATLRTLYCIAKTRNMWNVMSPLWEETHLSLLDSALNELVDSIPEHIRWNPHNENLRFFAQSVFINCAIHHLQVLVHRPFLPTKKKRTALSSASLAICTNAARSCSRIFDIYYKRTGQSVCFTQFQAFAAGIVLLLQTWSEQSTFLNVAQRNERISDVQKCLDLLERLETRWESAGRFRFDSHI
ncbi:fungal-specific transcription factor domain-containing protein [Mycena floridula]|nr:fungal-specific transcription factor domain-containing protein [Mycena floridula]